MRLVPQGKVHPKGGPDGGDGGKGGDVVIVGDANVSTLLDFRYKHHFRARRGEDGRGKNQHGADGEGIELRFPPGTLVYDHDSGEVLCDLREGDRVVLARGGKGGFGNDHFKSPTNQVPRQSTDGEDGVEIMLRLELKLIADIGLIGLPNAGKSTLLSAVTAATPKIADYPFTTLSPQLGIAELDASRRVVLADIPGLIEGAAEGHGLGHEFLRHVERTRVLVHVLDASPIDGSSPADNYRTIRAELSAYSAVLAEKPEIIALNKTDLLGDPEAAEASLEALRAELRLGRDDRLLAVSGATHAGLAPLLEACWAEVGGADEPWPARGR